MSVQLSERYQQRLEGLSDLSSARLTRLWDLITSQGGGEDQWVRAAKPLIRGVASAAVDLSRIYATLNLSEAPGALSPLIVADAVAHVHEPLMVVNKALGEGVDWASAVKAARSTAASLGTDVAMSTGRQALADLSPAGLPHVRSLNSTACRWCLSLSGVIWPNAAAASFGHPDCKCTPRPVGDIGDHNDRMRDAAGWDDQAKATYKVRHQISRLRKSEDLAMRHSREAAAQAKRETDPVRLERLSIREQDWETRAERAAERRRILETGTHLLAA